ncbi:MAG: NosD domain-containing protein, partial [Mucilaginibacter sp.]
INVTNISNLRVTNCNFIDTGNTSLSSVINTSASDGGGFIDGNIFNRSDLDYSAITAPCVSIAGFKSPTSGAITTISNWIFTNNKVLVPAAPTDPSAGCLETTYMLKSTIGNNTFSGGSIGLNMIACSSMTASKNSFYNSINGIEVTTSGSNHVLDSNVIDGNNQATSIGIILNGADATDGANHNTLSNNTITNVASACIQLNNYADSNNIIGGILVCGNSSATGGAIDVSGAKRTLISAIIMNGNGTGANGIFLDSSITGFQTKNTVINGCVFNNFTNAINVYYPAGGSVTGLRLTNNVSNGNMFTASAAANIVTPYYYGNSPEIIGSKVILGTTGTGSSPSIGTATLASGTAHVSNNLVTANSEIFFSVSAVSGSPGILSYAVSPGSGFTITSSSSSDASTISWIIVN